MLGTILLLALTVPLGLGVWHLFHPRRAATMGSRFLRGLGWVGLWVLPAVVAQFVRGPASWSPEALLYAPLAWGVLLGGASVQHVFEASVTALFGSRQSTMSHGEWYLLLAAVQTAALSFVVAVRQRHGAPWKDPIAFCVGGLALLNAILGVDWPWWGT